MIQEEEERKAFDLVAKHAKLFSLTKTIDNFGKNINSNYNFTIIDGPAAKHVSNCDEQFRTPLSAATDIIKKLEKNEVTKKEN